MKPFVALGFILAPHAVIQGFVLFVMDTYVIFRYVDVISRLAQTDI